jgi:single-strand DNA-binding protein
MNIISFTGNLGRDAEVRHVGENTVCDFSVGVRTGFGKNEGTAWVKCAVWGKRAEGELPDYLVKGQQVAVSGDFSMQEWTDKEGNARTTLACNVNSLDLVGKKSEGSDTPAKKNEAPQRQSNTQEASDDFVDSDIPF